MMLYIDDPVGFPVGIGPQQTLYVFILFNTPLHVHATVISLKFDSMEITYTNQL